MNRPLKLSRILDVGASQLIIDGKIKLKSDGPIKKFTPTGLLFEDGSILDADVVVFATGFGFLSLHGNFVMAIL